MPYCLHHNFFANGIEAHNNSNKQKSNVKSREQSHQLCVMMMKKKFFCYQSSATSSSFYTLLYRSIFRISLSLQIRSLAFIQYHLFSFSAGWCIKNRLPWQARMCVDHDIRGKYGSETIFALSTLWFIYLRLPDWSVIYCIYVCLCTEGRYMESEMWQEMRRKNNGELSKR